jgi:hypothetical protein
MTSMPASTDTVANFPLLLRGCDGYYFADRLMARNTRKRGHDRVQDCGIASGGSKSVSRYPGK